MKISKAIRSAEGGKSIERRQHKDPWDPRGGIWT